MKARKTLEEKLHRRHPEDVRYWLDAFRKEILQEVIDSFATENPAGFSKIDVYNTWMLAIERVQGMTEEGTE
jgi:hypothetical protein